MKGSNSIRDPRRMGIRLTREPPSSAELAYHLKKRNCKVSKRIYKIIEKAYLEGYLQEFEFNTTIGWYHGLKSRHIKEKDDIFIAGIDRLNDFICELIQDRYEARIKEAQKKQEDEIQVLRPIIVPPPSPKKAKKEEKVDASMKDLTTFTRILEASPYLQLAK